MGVVTDYLCGLIARQVQECGLVVWYDPDRAYEVVASHLEIPGAEVFRLEDSLLRLRAKVEPLIEFVGSDGQFTESPEKARRLVIYVPHPREDLHFGLIELDRAGSIMEPGAPALPRNTRLEVVARHALAKVMAGDQVEAICVKVAKGQYRLEDLDRLAEQGPGPGVGGLILVYGTAEAGEVTLRFLTDPNRDEALVARGVMPELAALLTRELGIRLDDSVRPQEARQDLERLALLTDFVASLRTEQVPPSLEFVELPSGPTERQAIRALMDRWRNRADLRPVYLAAAKRVEEEVGANRFRLSLEALTSVNTFPCHESQLLRLAEETALAGEFERICQIARERKLAFWPGQEGAWLLRWHLIETVCRLIAAARKFQEEVKTSPRIPEVLVRRYCEGEASWCVLDTLHRHVERQYAAFDLAPDADHEGLQRLVELGRREYMEGIGAMAEAFSSALEAKDFDCGGLPRQAAVFATHVQPPGQQEEKTAFILVDALRFEMARELLEGLHDRFAVDLGPVVAMLPTITPVGMAALLPGAEMGMTLLEGGKGNVGIDIGGKALKDRAARVAFIQEKVAGPIIALKLEDLLKPSKFTRDKLANARLVIVTSRELDSLSEGEHVDLARQAMDAVLDHLRRVIRNLAALGVARVVVSADHGYLFGEAIEIGMKIDPPAGKTTDLHRRVWIGKGGETGPGVLRVPTSRVGLQGGLELVFPRGLACFKVKGGDRQFFHGGISLQEVVVPVAVLRVQAAKPVIATRPTIVASMERKKVTTRFFSVTLTYEETGLYDPGALRVKLIGRTNRKDVAVPAMAAYGFEEGTREMILQRGKPNPVTMMLTSEVESRSITVHVLDASTEVELARIEGIEVDLSI